MAAWHLDAEQRQVAEVAVDLRRLEAAPQDRDVLMDAAGRQGAGDLAGDPFADVVRVDLGERVAAEFREQLAAQDPAVALAGLVLHRPRLDPAGGVGSEGHR